MIFSENDMAGPYFVNFLEQHNRRDILKRLLKPGAVAPDILFQVFFGFLK